MGLLPTATVLCVTILHHENRHPFALGFITFGGLAILGYFASCRTVPDAIAVPVLYHLNGVEPRLVEADTLGSDSLSLLFRGLILASPQLLIALAGGLLARLVFRDVPHQ